MANELGGDGIRFAFVYTREAHPSDRYPGHATMAQKIGVARTMAERLGLERPMLVDDLDGSVHHAYGRLPNMTYVVDRAGTIFYRAAWTDPRTIRVALDQLLHERGERREKRRMTPYYVEWMPRRFNDDVAFVRELFELGGARPVEEYVDAMERSEGAAATTRIREWWSRTKAGL